MTETKERYVTYEEFNDFKHHDFQEVKDDLKDLREDVTEMRADLRVMDTRLTNVEKTLETFATKDEMQLMFHDCPSTKMVVPHSILERLILRCLCRSSLTSEKLTIGPAINCGNMQRYVAKSKSPLAISYFLR